MTLLTFHTIGFFLQVYVPMTTGLPVAIYTPQSPAPPILPNPLNVLELVKLLGCNGVLVMPSIIEIWTQSEESVAFLTTLQALMYGGGPLSAENGDKLVAAGVKLCTLYGATEFGTPIRILDTEYSKSPDPGAKTPEDWAWLQFSSLTQPKWVDQGDGTFELQLLNCDTHEPNVENMENPRGYATSDLFISHPTKKGLWRLVGRADDVVVLSSGEKIVPVPQQNFLVSTKYASGALIFGRGETQAGVLIEPRSEFVVDPDDEKALMDFKNMIWPCVDAANKLAPSFARIFKEMIIITKPSKPMIRAAKGTVMRKLTLAAYEIEISNLYGKDIGTSGNSITGPESWASKDVLTWLTLQAESIHHREEVDPGRDLFEQGFDSLSATFLRNRIIGALRCYKRNDETAFAVPPSFVFMYPTLQDLAVATVNLLSTNGATQNGHVGASSVRDIHTSLNKYLSLLPGLFPLVPRTSEDGAVVLLTGSTGSLGSHILAGLLSDERVARVFAFNRENSRFKQVAAFAERGLPVELLSSRKLLEIVGNSSKDDLGLEDRVLTEIKTSVTHIIHNAWKVDFNLSLQSFDTQIAGASNFIKLCALSSQSVKFFFTSSIGVARNWDSGRSGSVPEDVMHDANVAAGQGYAASKYVVEQLLEKARERGLSATSIRLGQISGSSKTGSWPATEWFPILIKSSIALGCLPTQENVRLLSLLSGFHEINMSMSMKAITWVPVDIVAQTIVDYVHAATDSPNGLPIVLNLVHHRPSSWNTIIDAINDALPSRLLLLPFSEWVKKIESVNTSSAPDVLGQVPAAKLLDFFRGLAKSSVSATKQGTASHFVTAQSQRFSLALRDAQVISTENAALWIRYWKEIDFLAARGHA
ncbi:hypothetical protein EUX98_g2444 [Antrodiella citrinella]|uniref:Polyketide synthase-like phosphopantetheine-binding domain-containing protein n=1 Tax=Antrodiella citrinella TaxID=2447956 RepID=A0A4V3XJ50_9APHY|nr:hypothetical protein EUX98_g2444 [Antrodiella citrinella]